MFRPTPALAALLLASCVPPVRLARDDSAVVLASHTIQAPDPTRRGAFPVRTLFYGSGTDRRRAEYRDSVTIETETVDASKLVDLGNTARSRNDYWGFTPKEMPLNGRVWYPEGEGPFPLVLIVHGNHDMKDFSDPGYAYLGELLASRGYIFASVDMNFINGGIRGENDARGWFLLKHVEAFEGFNGSEGNPFQGKVDLTRVALIGHSRGGEAVGHAAAFNELAHYPDDATFDFDFGYGIRSLIAIAPVDGQYRPSEKYVPVENVSYLVFHGSHDGDVTSFAGLRQYQRVRFDNGEPGLKAAVYVYRANHGQWNTVWGARDRGPRSARSLDLSNLMLAEDQRRVAEVYVSAFLETTLRGDSSYLPLFRDHRVAGGWLPRTMYITRYEDSSFRPILTYEEDIDVTTGTAHGVRAKGDSLQSWKEAGHNLRTTTDPAQGSSLQNYAAWLGWNNRIQGADTAARATPAAYTVTIPEATLRSLGVDEGSSLQFVLMPTIDEPGPRRPKADSTAARDSTASGRGSGPSGGSRSDEDEKPPMDLTIEAVDANGVRAALPLSRYGAVRRPLEMTVTRRRDTETTSFARLYELVLQSYRIPLADFRAAAPTLDPRRITTVRFLFDRTPAGTVILDDVGFAR
jgi:dienelactone hydrolase